MGTSRAQSFTFANERRPSMPAGQVNSRQALGAALETIASVATARAFG